MTAASIQSDTSSSFFTPSAQSTVTPESSVECASVLPPPQSRHRPSRSFSLLHNFIPKDKFSSLIRTHSASRSRRQSAIVINSQKEIVITNPTLNDVLADYANQQQTYNPEQCTMLISNMNHNETGAGGGPKKSENKLYNFFRPRSRSRSKTKPSRSQSADAPSADDGTCPPLPPPPTTHSHTIHASLDNTNGDIYLPAIFTSPSPRLNGITASGSKPATRSQSRPLSATTTGTHSTITSLVTPTQTRMARPKPKKFGSGSSNGRGSIRPVSSTSILNEGCDYEPEPDPSTSTASSIPSSSSPPSSQPASTSTSLSAAAAPKQPSARRLKLHNLFGIPLTGSHRSSVGARSNDTPTSPVLELPPSRPLPARYTARYADLSTTSHNRPLSSYRRATSPSPQGRSDEASTNLAATGTGTSGKTKKEKRRSATAPASWLARGLFSGSNQTVDPDSATISTPLIISQPRLTTVNPDSTSTLHTQTTHTHASSSGDRDRDRDRGMSGSIHAPRPSEDVPPIPKITHTPPTPQRSGPAASSSSLSSQTHRRGVSSPKLSGHGYGHGRNRSLVVVGDASLSGLGDEVREDKEEQSKRGRWSPKLFGGKDLSRDKGKEKEMTSEWDRLVEEKEKLRAKLTSPSARIGSPIDSRANGNGTGSALGLGASTRNARSSKHGSFDFEGSRPLSAGSSSGSRATVMATPSAGGSESTVKSKVGKLGRTVSFSNAHSRRHHDKEARHNQPSTSTSPRTHRRALTDAAGPVAAPLFPNHTGGAPAPAAAGGTSTHHRKANQPGSTALSSSWGRTTAATATSGHNGSGSSNAKRRGIGLAHGSFPFEPAVPPCSTSAPAASELGVLMSGDSGYGESQSANGSTTTTTITNGAGTGRRGKGRSFDLNIGLAWAPTKVKEEAVMSAFSTKGRERREKDKEEWRRFERGVSDVFQDVLGEGGFATFKKYIRSFDAQKIPLDGPSGLITRVAKLLDAAPPPGLEEHEKQELLERFMQVVLKKA